MGVQVNFKHLMGITILISLIAPVTANQIHYIKPNDNTTCPLEPCQELSYYMENSYLLQSHTTYYFLEGTHSLEREGLLKLFWKTNLTLTGESISIPPVSNLTEYNPPSRIMCTGRGGFAFLFSTDIIISNLIFVNCGAKVPYFDAMIYSVLYFQTTTNIITSGVVVQNSSGYGLFVYDPQEKIVISHSAFQYNTGSNEYAGGNILVASLPINVDCSRQTQKEWNLSIESAMIAYGSNTNSTTLEAGLTVLVNKWQCIGSEILVNNVILVGNGGPRVSGGNLFIQVREYGYQHGNNSRISIANSIIKGGRAAVGGGMTLLITTSSCSMVSGDTTSLNPVDISNTTFISNTAFEKGGGLYITMDEVCTRYSINLNNLNFTGNEVLNNIVSSSELGLTGDINTGVGGNVAIYTYRATSSAPLHSIILENSVIQAGQATIGAGLAIFTLTKVKNEDSFQSNTDILQDNQVYITNTLITENSGVAGGGIFIVATGVVGTSQSFINSIQLYNSTFRKNTGYIGSAMYILTNGILPYSIQNQFLMENVSFQYNHRTMMNELYITDFLDSLAGHAFQIDPNASVTVALQGVQNITFTDCEFSYNNGTGILAIQSSVFFQGNVVFQGNTGKNGGGLSLFGSFVFPKLHTKIRFLNNHAQQAGGGIHVDWEHSPLYSIYCFLQPDVDVLYNNSLVDVDIQIVFQGNTAEYAGSALYGGHVDQCLMIDSATTDDSAARFVYLTNAVGYSTEVFNSVFNFSNDTGFSVISSNPVGVCVCDHGEPKCDVKVEYNSTFPGSTYEVSVVVVGQREGVVPAIVRATLSANYSQVLSSFGELQTSQSVGKSCTLLKYTIFSSNELENITLTVEQPAPSLASPFLDFFTPPILSISMFPCPQGFNLSGTPPQCNCASSLLKQNITCNITDQTIHRRAAMWIGYHYTDLNTSNKDGVILHNHCPFDYCEQEDINLNLFDPDEQCAFNRHGILCGGCKTGLSLALGSSQCIRCSNRYLALILAFGAAGLALVLLLTICNLTVAEGAINGLIFYANIVHINRAVFFPQGDTSFLGVFIAWLNLDLGIQACFYDGLDAYAKTWLQLLFPLYIWAIVIVIIIWSHYSTIVTRLISRNAVKVLATLFLLSYTKLLRVIIAALSFTVLKYPDQHETVVWLYDGNVEYLRGKHIPLFLAGVLVLCLLSLPYTFLLLLWSCLQYKKGRCRCLTVRWKPLFDAYVGPYKDRYRFWTGLLLLCRNVLFLVFAFNALGNPDLNLLAIGLLSNCLLMFGWGTGGVYRLQPLSILESSFFLNLAAVSLSTMYVRHAGGNQYAVAYTSAGIAFVIFAAIVLYYTLNRIRNSINKRKQDRPVSPTTELEVLSSVAEQGNNQSKHVEAPPSASVLRLKIENNEVILVPDNELEN